MTTLAAEPWAKGKGWAFRVESRLAGTPDGDRVSTYESYLIPGKQLLSGSQHFAGFDFWHAKPAKGLRLVTAEGFGLVKAQTRVETWQNGALEETQKWIESLASGSLGGVPFP